MATRVGRTALVSGCVMALWLGGGGILSPALARPAGEDDLPREDRYVYRRVPDVPIYTRTGVVRLSQLWRQKPILLTLVYTRCSGICYPFLRSLKAAVPKVGGLGEDYRVVVLSFDPRDTVETVTDMARSVGLADHPAWVFGVASREDVHRLAEAVGYWSRWDPTLRQYDHPSVLIGIDRGAVVRFLVGGTVAPARLYEVVRELRGEFVGTYPLPKKNVVFRCFQYRPGQGVTLDWGFLLLLLPGGVALGGTAYLFWQGHRARCRSHRSAVPS